MLLPTHTDEGQWLIGVEKLVPGQSLGLLVQVQEGTADANPPAVVWSTLAGNARARATGR